MPSNYSSLKIQLMATGENSGTWGTVTNTNLGTAIEEAIVGSADVTFASADVTLTLTDTNATQAARNLRLNLVGTVSGPQNLIVPAIEKVYIVNNTLSSDITVKNSTGSGIAVKANSTTYVYNNGTNVVDAINYLSSLSLGTPLPVASGGTGSATGSFSGANITSINASNISSGVLAVAQGGTGSNTATFSGANITSINANNISTGTLAVARGGTGAATLTAESVVVGNGTSAVKFVAPGTAGNILSSNGTAWVSTVVSAGFNGATETTSAVDITLTNTSKQYQVVAMNAASKSVILPNATTMNLGASAFVIRSAGENAFFIKTSTGNIVDIVGSYDQINLNLYSQENTFVKSVNVSNTNANQSGYGYGFGTGPIQNSTITTTGLLYVKQILPLTSTTFAILYMVDSTTSTYLVVGTVSGTTITYGTPLLISSATASTSTTACVLTSTLLGVSLDNGATGRIYPVSVSGTTLTLGTPYGATFTARGICAVSATTALIFNGSNNVNVVTFSGTSAPTLGASAASGLSATNITFQRQMLLIDTNKVIAVDSVGDAQIYTISGTTVTAATAFTTGPNFGSPSLYKISITEAVYFTNDNMARITLSGSTITAITGYTNALNNIFNQQIWYSQQTGNPSYWQVSTTDYVMPNARIKLNTSTYTASLASYGIIPYFDVGGGLGDLVPLTSTLAVAAGVPSYTGVSTNTLAACVVNLIG